MKKMIFILILVAVCMVSVVFVYFFDLKKNTATQKIGSGEAVPMTYETAYAYALSYADKEGLDIEKSLKVKTEDRFRFDFNSVDMSFDETEGILVVRAVIARENSRREDFLALLPGFTEKYKGETAGGYFEYDETALEVDGYKPNRLNLRMDFQNTSLSDTEFYKKTIDLLTAALRFEKEHYLNIYLELNKNRKQLQ